MLSRMMTSGVLAAVAGVAMLATVSTSASAFTLQSPALDRPVASADVQHVWWDSWGRWHPNRYWGPAPLMVAPAPYYWHRHRNCWVGRWGHVHCGW